VGWRLAAVAAQAVDAAEARLRAAHAALLETPGLQHDFDAAPPFTPPPWLKPLLEFLQAAGPVLKVVVWIGLAAGLVMILWFVARELLATRFRPKREIPALVDWRPDAEAARALLEDAEALAADGRFAEAIHVLLFRSIEEIGGRRPGVVRPALTSRDIARDVPMPAAAASAFARMAGAVERSFFGGRAVGPDDFDVARADYQAFAFAEGWA